MKVPLEIAFHNLEKPDWAEKDIRKHVARLERIHEVVSCRVRVEKRAVNASDSNKGTLAPCGAIPPFPVQTQFAANADLTVSWFETVNHTGWFELRFAENGPGDCTMTSNGGAVEPTRRHRAGVARR